MKNTGTIEDKLRAELAILRFREKYPELPPSQKTLDQWERWAKQEQAQERQRRHLDNLDASKRWEIPESHGIFDLIEIRKRLKAEGESELLRKNACCQEPIVLHCVACEKDRLLLQRCKRRWCPCCAKRLAAARSAELNYIVERMRRPLFVTLTMRNVETISRADIRRMFSAFNRLRHQKWWKLKVAGGLVAMEVTNEGRGWHPHLHAVIDCVWLSDGIPSPRRGSPKEEWEARCKAAAQSVERRWSKLLKQETSSIRIKSANRSTIAKEVVKYTVKGEHLVCSVEPIGPLIHAMENCRMMRTFGSAHGQKMSDIRKMAKLEAKRQSQSEDQREGINDCCARPIIMPDAFMTAAAQRQARALQCAAA